jgi:hypothetical protein
MDLSGPGIDVKLKERKKERLVHHKKIFKKSINQSLDTPKINTFASVFSFGLVHIIYKSRELGQRLWDNVSSCWEQVEELIGNLGTCLVFNENNKYPVPPLFPRKKEKNLGGLMCG